MTYKKFYKNQKVLVTGATGFKGSWLCFWLKILGAKVYGIGHNPNKNDKLFYQINLHKKINFKILDIRDNKKLKSYIKKIKPKIIFHLAAQPIISTGYEKPKETYEINSLGTLNLIEIIRGVSFVKSAIFVTSDKCYESNESIKGFKENDKLGGKDPYSGSKACAEIIIKTYINSFFSQNTKIGIATARAGNVIGGGDWSKDRLIPDAIKSLRNKKPIIIRNPNFNRPWQHVLEPLNGYLMLGFYLIKNPKKYSGPWNFGTEKNTITSVQQVIMRLIKSWGAGKFILKNKKKFYEQINLQLDISKSKKNLNWKPLFSINQCIGFTVKWYKNVIQKKFTAEQMVFKQINEFMNLNEKKKN
jgi:CDP-glucose 4,6-dehydratase